MAKESFLKVLSLIEIKHRLKEPLFKNSIALMLTGGLSSALGFFFWIIVARYYPPAEVGSASALISAVMLLYVLSSMGLYLGLIRFLPATADKPNMINSCFTITGTVALILGVIFIAGLRLWSPNLAYVQKNIGLMFFFLILPVLYALAMLQKNVFVALRRAEFSLAQQTIFGLIRLALPVALVSLGVMGILSSFGIATALALIIANLFLIRLQPGYRPFPALKKSVVNEMVHFSFANYVADILSGAHLYLLPLVVVNRLGAEQNAYFYMAYSIAMVLYVIPLGITMSFFTEGSYHPEELRFNAIRAARFLFLFLIPALAFIFILGDKLLLLFGQPYAENAFRILRWLALTTIPQGIMELWVAIQRVRLKTGLIIRVYLLTAIAILGPGYLLITRMGLEGIGIGWLVGQGAVAAILGLIMARSLFFRGETG